MVVPQNGYLEVVQHASRYTSANHTYNFLVKDHKEVLIGRDLSCSIKLNWDKTYSKFQTSIIWDEQMDQWYIVDGKGNSGSRNGSWVYASKSCEIYDGLIFKIGNSKVKVNMITQSKYEEEDDYDA